MRKGVILWIGACFALAPFPKTLHAIDFTPPIVIDHQCADLAQIPLVWIRGVQNNVKVHYAHQSHGIQLITGLNMIEFGNSTYADTAGAQTLPAVPGSLCILDGGTVIPDYHWSTACGLDDRGRVLPDGIYFYRLKGPDGSFATKKMIKLRK